MVDSAPPSSAMDVVVSDRANPISKGGEEHSVYSTAAAVWDESELLVLEEGRRSLSPEQYSNMTIYIKIASKLPHKTVRDVAARFKMILAQQQGGLHQQHAAMAAMLAGSMGFQGHNIMGQGLAGPRLSDRQTEARLQQSLHENSMLISKIRENLVTGRMRENGNLMEKFNENTINTMKQLSMLQLRMPPLPVQVNTSLIDPLRRGPFYGDAASQQASSPPSTAQPR